MRVLLFGLTGFGNQVLKRLVAHPLVDWVGVLTEPRSKTPFPYYDSPFLEEEANRLGVPVMTGIRLTDPEILPLILSLEVDVILVATFRQIIPMSVIVLPRWGVVNLHPSLLPRNRGATPTFWTILNEDTETGVTAHLIGDEHVDRGAIVAQRVISLTGFETDGSLRQQLALLAGDVASEAIFLIDMHSPTAFLLQDESLATYFPKRGAQESELNPEEPFRRIHARWRAVTPWPGAFLRWEGEVVAVESVRLLRDMRELPGWSSREGKLVRVAGVDGEVVEFSLAVS